MLIADLLGLVLSIVVVRGIWRLVGGVIEGLSGTSGQAGAQGRTPFGPRDRGGVPAQGVQMVRDPVCGTYVVPNRALSLGDGSRQVFFCSPDCRDRFRARTA